MLGVDDEQVFVIDVWGDTGTLRALLKISAVCPATEVTR